MAMLWPLAMISNAAMKKMHEAANPKSWREVARQQVTACPLNRN